MLRRSSVYLRGRFVAPMTFQAKLTEDAANEKVEQAHQFTISSDGRFTLNAQRSSSGTRRGVRVQSSTANLTSGTWDAHAGRSQRHLQAHDVFLGK